MPKPSNLKSKTHSCVYSEFTFKVNLTDDSSSVWYKIKFLMCNNHINLLDSETKINVPSHKVAMRFGEYFQNSLNYNIEFREEKN